MRRTGHYTDCAEHRKTHPRPSAEEAESALAGISAAPIIPLTITRAESALARESATAIIALAITPRAGILGAYLAPPNGIGSGRLAPALMAACGFLRLLGRGGGPRRRLGRGRHLGGRCRRRFGRARLGNRHTRRGGRRFSYALRRGDAADRDRSNWRAIRFDANRAWLARDAAITFATEIGPGSIERTVLRAVILDRSGLTDCGEARSRGESCGRPAAGIRACRDAFVTVRGRYRARRIDARRHIARAQHSAADQCKDEASPAKPQLAAQARRG